MNSTYKRIRPDLGDEARESLVEHVVLEKVKPNDYYYLCTLEIDIST